MTTKAYTDIDGNILLAEEVVFPEDLNDIIDYTYIKDVWYVDPQEIYSDILSDVCCEELFKGIF